MHFTLPLVLSLIPAATAHFHLYYPWWRGDSLALAKNNQSISQWFWPCAGIGQETSATNRTLWPLTGGAVVWNSSHESALTYINLGLGGAAPTFNISLHGVYNETGAGVTCLTDVGAAVLPALNLTEGQQASIQVVTISSSGASLYNCADITFSAHAPPVDPGLCANSTGVGGAFIMNAPAVGSAGGANSSSAKAGGPGRTVPVAALVGAVGLAVAGLV